MFVTLRPIRRGRQNQSKQKKNELETFIQHKTIIDTCFGLRNFHQQKNMCFGIHGRHREHYYIQLSHTEHQLIKIAAKMQSWMLNIHTVTYVHAFAKTHTHVEICC